MLEDLLALRAARDADDIPTGEILAELHGLEERPWSKWGKHRQPIDSHQLARLLRPFGVRPMSFGGRVRGYRFSAGLADAASRYVNSPVPRQTPVEPVIASFPQVRADVDPSYGFEGDDGSKVPVTSAYDAMTGQTGVSSGAPASEPDTGVGEEGSRDPEAVIEAIRVHGPQSVPALAKRLGWTWSEVSRVLRELEAEGRVWSYVDDDQGAEVYDLREVS